MKHTKNKNWDYEQIEYYINEESNSGCKLQTTKTKFKELLKSKPPTLVKLKISCECTSVYRVTFSDFINKNQIQCKKCSKKIQSERQKYTYQQVNEFIEKLGYQIISNYRDSHTKLTLKDEYGYLYFSSFTHLKFNYSKGKKLRICDKTNPYTIQNIKLWCNLNNKPFELISEKYEGNNKHLQWQCLKEGCKEIFSASWNNILTGWGCGVCDGRQVGISNCLATKRPDLALEWHPTKNGDFTPYDVTSGSHKMVWWECKECGHEWEKEIHQRTNNCCPECNESKGEKKCKNYFILNNILYIKEKSFNGLLGIGKRKLRYDFYLPKYNLLIEYQGEQHERFCKGIHKSKKDFEKQLEHDKRKKEYALSNGYNFLEIWYYDFDKIEEILNDLGRYRPSLSYLI